MIKFDFERKSLNVVKIIESMSNGVPLKLNVILRGVCCSDKYIIYVSQRACEDPGFIQMLCLQLDESKCNLQYVCERDDYTSNCKKM